MKLPLVLLALLLGFSSFSQVNILVSDETGGLFTLGIDGFLQNPTPQKKIIVSNLDTSEHILIFKVESDSIQVDFERRLKLSTPGNYKYVLTQNFVGRFQLRFRGKTTSLPNEVLNLSLNRTTTWPFNPVALNQKEIPALVANKDNVPVNTLKDTLSASITLSEVKTPSDSIPMPDVPKKTKDTASINIASSTITSVKDSIVELPKAESVKVEKDNFQILIQKISTEKYEFNRLNLAKNYLIENSISISQLKTIFDNFNYDNSRMQYMPYAKERLTDPENLKKLLDSFDYELTREQFKKVYLL